MIQASTRRASSRNDYFGYDTFAECSLWRLTTATYVAEWKIITSRMKKQHLPKVDNKSLNKKEWLRKRNVKLRWRRQRLPSAASLLCMHEFRSFWSNKIFAFDPTNDKSFNDLTARKETIPTQSLEKYRTDDDRQVPAISSNSFGDRKWARFRIRRVSAATAMNYRRRKNTTKRSKEQKQNHKFKRPGDWQSETHKKHIFFASPQIPPSADLPFATKKPNTKRHDQKIE